MPAVNEDAELHLALVGRADEEALVPVICVHDTDGNGQDQLAAVRASAREGLDFNALLVCPSFETPYQFLVDGIDRWLIDRLAESAAELRMRLARKVCIFGLGGGGGFAHRFAMRLPDHSLACAAFSADCWTLPNGAPFGPLFDETGGRGGIWKDPAIVRGANTRANRHWRQVRYLVGGGRNEPPGIVAAAQRFHAELEFAGAAVDYIEWDHDLGDSEPPAPPDVMRQVWDLFNQAVSERDDVYD